jgi:hypothetical protein
VREDYSPDGGAWNYFPHDHARSRAYRWGEDGLLGICDRKGRLCFALALWNGRDPILKERLFGLSGKEGNHGEDVKEYYYYLDATPTHSYLKALYKYPQTEFPYRRLLEENRRRGINDGEFELEDTGIFDQSRYFDVMIEYAQSAPECWLIRITTANRGPELAQLHVLPTLWFRNTWSWGQDGEDHAQKPAIVRLGDGAVRATHETLGAYCLRAQETAPLLFTENETNASRLYGIPNRGPVKDAFHEQVIHEKSEARSSEQGTKAALWYRFELQPGAERTLNVCLHAEHTPRPEFGTEFAQLMDLRKAEADAFHTELEPAGLTCGERNVMRQARAGLIWTKQFYHYAVHEWLAGDPLQPSPPAKRQSGRNHDWNHLYNRDVISVPDKWEYPWYAAWDLAFHMLPFSCLDIGFAKEQLILLLREWYMHPNGQIPAYEWALSDVNPPVHAWACWRVYKRSGPPGHRDLSFLARAFQKLMLNFTWWVNRKDHDGRHVFAGGFLGLDNVGVFDRSKAVPQGARLAQADGTAWMGFFCATMLHMALELAQHDRTYEDVASKFFEHFVAIADSMNTLGGSGLWDEEDGFYYDQLEFDGGREPLRLRSMVGLVALCACENLDHETIMRLPQFRHRMEWFLRHRSDLSRHASMCSSGTCCPGRRLLAIPSRERLMRMLRYMLDPNEFLSPFGIRSLSMVYRDHPFRWSMNGQEYRVAYAPGESTTWMFGGNSNWRGPVWLPMNYLLIEALERYHHFYGDELRVECPTGSVAMMTLGQVAQELSRRLCAIFLPDDTGQRPCFGNSARYTRDAHWRDLVLFHEYFHGDTGRGLGASHQTGWTALVADLLARNRP